MANVDGRTAVGRARSTYRCHPVQPGHPYPRAPMGIRLVTGSSVDAKPLSWWPLRLPLPGTGGSVQQFYCTLFEMNQG